MVVLELDGGHSVQALSDDGDRAASTLPEETPGLIGVLGGMGPLATIDFMRKVLIATPAASDQDHVPMVVSSIPQVPDRTAAFRGEGISPLAAPHRLPAHNAGAAAFRIARTVDPGGPA